MYKTNFKELKWVKRRPYQGKVSPGHQCLLPEVSYSHRRSQKRKGRIPVLSPSHNFWGLLILLLTWFLFVFSQRQCLMCPSLVWNLL